MPTFISRTSETLATPAVVKKQPLRALLSLIVAAALVGISPALHADYYHRADRGSDSLYTPLNSFSHYTFDTLQMSENFDQHNFDQHFGRVLDNISHPGESIRSEGGWGHFINSQAIPYNTQKADDWPIMLPNYALHLFGGGLVYRRDLEFYRAHNYSHPLWAAIGTAMTAELAQEAIEKKSSTADDPVADVLIFRPLGIWLFSDDSRADYIEKNLKPAIWPNMVFYDPSSDEIHNAGVSYVVRPPLLSAGNNEVFLYMGMNNLLGLSHTFASGNTLSVGAGIALTHISYVNGDLQYASRPSVGLFSDRNGNLLWSAIYNGTEDLKLRVNIYPWQHQPIKYGLALGITDDHRGWFGVTLNMPLGLGHVF